MHKQEYEEEIDLLEYINVLKSKLIWILLCAVSFASAGYYYSANYLIPIYEASINLIVNADTEATTMVTISDINSASVLVDTYAVIIKSNRVLDRVVEELDLDMTWSALNSKVQVNAVNDTSVMSVAVYDSDPDEAMRIVLKISEIAPDILVQSVHAGSCEIVSDAYTSGVPVSPNIPKYTEIGFLLGAVCCSALVCLMHLLNNTISNEEELNELLGIPVLGVIPEIDSVRRKTRRRK